jgi:AraC-like DNA-binding protein
MSFVFQPVSPLSQRKGVRELFRKYFSESRLRNLEDSGPGVHTVGHHLHPPQRPYPDPEHPSTHVFNREKGRRLQEFQMIYIASGQGIYEGADVKTTGIEGVAFRQISSCLVIQMLGLVYASALMRDKTRLRQEQVIEAVRFRLHLRETALTIAEIAARAGFESEFYFSRLFKKKTGQTPSEYRRKK